MAEERKILLQYGHQRLHGPLLRRVIGRNFDRLQSVSTNR